MPLPINRLYNGDVSPGTKKKKQKENDTITA